MKRVEIIGLIRIERLYRGRQAFSVEFGTLKLDDFGCLFVAAALFGEVLKVLLLKCLLLKCLPKAQLLLLDREEGTYARAT